MVAGTVEGLLGRALREDVTDKAGKIAVSYTHLTPPTSDLVVISVVAVSFKKKKKKKQEIMVTVRS